MGQRSIGAWVARALFAGGSLLVLASAGGGCGAVAEPTCEGDPDGGLPLECCNPCPVLSDCGAPVPFHSYPSQQQTVREWRRLCEYDTSVSHGECANGLRYLVWSNGLATEFRYFDAAGAFVAVEGYVDLIDEACQGRWYWPKPIDCAEKKWGAILCTPPDGY